MLVASGRPGHRHVFCKVADQHDESVQEAQALGADVRRDIRPPLTPHRSGHVVALLLPDDPQEVLARLDGTLRPVRLGAAAQAVVHRAFAPKSVSESVFSVAMGCVNAEWSAQEFHLLLETAGTGIHTVYLQRAERRGLPRHQEVGRGRMVTGETTGGAVPGTSHGYTDVAPPVAVVGHDGTVARPQWCRSTSGVSRPLAEVQRLWHQPVQRIGTRTLRGGGNLVPPHCCPRPRRATSQRRHQATNLHQRRKGQPYLVQLGAFTECNDADERTPGPLTARPPRA